LAHVEFYIIGFRENLGGHSWDLRIDSNENLRFLSAPFSELVLLVLRVKLFRAFVRCVLVREGFFFKCDALGVFALRFGSLVLTFFLFFAFFGFWLLLLFVAT